MAWVHIVITRIGIGVYDEQWFDHRLALFEAITLPSMTAQTSQSFHWLLIVGQDMPAAARARLDDAVAPLSDVTILPVEFKTDLKKASSSWARAYAERAGADHVVTSRMDDDDALHVETVERLHHEADSFVSASAHDRAVVSFTTGSMWLPSVRRGYTRYHDSLGTGLSVIEAAEGCRSIYNWPHVDIKAILAPGGARIVGISEDRLWWLYTTHTLASTERGDNVRVKRILEHQHGYHLDDDLLATFGLDPAVIDRFAERPDPTNRKGVRHQWLQAMDLERELKQLRARLAETRGRGEAARLRARIEELEQERREAGSAIVAS